MDQTKPERPSPRYTYSAPLTDPTSLQSLLPVTFPLPTQQPLDLKLPETKVSRKRKASDVEDLGMSQPYRRPRQERSEDATINPQSLTTPLASTQYQYMDDPYGGQLPVSTPPYPAWQPGPPARNASMTVDPYYAPPYDVESTSSWSHRSSVTSTASQSMAPPYAPSFQQSYGVQYPPAPQPQHQPQMYPSPGSYSRRVFSSLPSMAWANMVK